MKPETCKSWEEALRLFGRAEELLKDKKWKEAEAEAMIAVVCGYDAMNRLSEELKNPDLSIIAQHACSDWFQRGGRDTSKHYTPEENIKWARRTLRQLSDELPPDTFPPFRY